MFTNNLKRWKIISKNKAKDGVIYHLKNVGELKTYVKCVLLQSYNQKNQQNGYVNKNKIW
jgi:hypothetical protein